MRQSSRPRCGGQRLSFLDGLVTGLLSARFCPSNLIGANGFGKITSQGSAARSTDAPVFALQLPDRDPLLRRLQLCLVVRRPQVLDLARPAPRRPHHLHRCRTRGGPYSPHVRGKATLRAAPSAQLQLQTTGIRRSATRDIGHGQIVAQLAPPGTALARQGQTALWQHPSR